MLRCYLHLFRRERSQLAARTTSTSTKNKRLRVWLTPRQSQRRSQRRAKCFLTCFEDWDLSRRITLCLRPEQWLSESLNFLGSTLVLKVRIIFVFKKVKELSFKQVPSVNNAQRCQRKSKTSTFLCSRKCSDSTTNESVLRPSLRQRDSSKRTPRLLWTPKSIWCWTCSKRLILMTCPRDHRIETKPQLNITKNR
jgi:hypothetical protein